MLRKEQTYHFKLNNETQSDLSLEIYYEKNKKKFITVQVFNYVKNEFVMDKHFSPEQEESANELFETLFDMMMYSETYDLVTETIQEDIEKYVRG